MKRPRPATATGDRPSDRLEDLARRLTELAKEVSSTVALLRKEEADRDPAD